MKSRIDSIISATCGCASVKSSAKICSAGYRYKPGHPVFSITCRDGLTALSWHGQLPDLCQHALKEIRKRPPEKPRRRCCPVCGSTIKVMQHRPHLVATHRQAAMVMLHLRERAVSTFKR